MLRRQPEKCVAEGFMYAHCIGLYLSSYLSWVLGPFVHGRLQNPKTSEDTCAHDITPLINCGASTQDGGQGHPVD